MKNISNKLALTARVDLQSILEYIAKDSTKLQIIRIKQKTKILKSQIHICKPVPEYGENEIRKVLEGNYSTSYQIVEEFWHFSIPQEI